MLILDAVLPDNKLEHNQFGTGTPFRAIGQNHTGAKGIYFIRELPSFAQASSETFLNGRHDILKNAEKLGCQHLLSPDLSCYSEKIGQIDALYPWLFWRCWFLHVSHSQKSYNIERKH